MSMRPGRRIPGRRPLLSAGRFLPVLAALISLAAAGLPAAAPAKQAPANVLLITIDTLRADRLGCYGNRDGLTPAIDRLASDSWVFERAFAHTPTTLPSHTSILTGATPLRHGVHDNVHFVVPPDIPTLAERLKAAGYATAAVVGAFPLDSRFGLTRGFDLYDDNYGTAASQEFGYVERRAEEVVRLGGAWLKGRSGPWFLWLHCFDPHLRYDPPEPFRTKHAARLYDGEVAYADSALGRLFDALREGKLLEKTLIILTGDHGESLGEHGESSHGYFAYNATLHVPLIVHEPEGRSGRSSQSVGHIDIAPTVCAWLGLPSLASAEGVSLVPCLKGRTLPEREIYVESLYPYYSRGWAPLRGFISGRGKYLDSPIPEFYDLGADFGETANLAETMDLGRFKDNLRRLMERGSPGTASSTPRSPDRATREKLQSLGYLASFRGPEKKTFTAADDLKVLLPFQTKLMNAMGAYHRGDLEGAVALLKDVIAKRPDFDLAYSYLATIYKEQNKFREALDVLRRGYEANPSSYRLVTAFGVFLAESGAADEALSLLNKGLSLNDHDPELWNYLGVAYWGKGLFDEALNAYESALALDRNNPVVLNNLGSLFLGRSQASKDRTLLAAAIDRFSKAIALAPDYASPYNGLGTAWAQAGDIEKAIAQWKKAVELKPDLAYPLYNLGASYAAKGDAALALEYLTRYRDKFSASLSPKEKKDLDELIRSCRKRAPR